VEKFICLILKTINIYWVLNRSSSYSIRHRCYKSAENKPNNKTSSRRIRKSPTNLHQSLGTVLYPWLLDGNGLTSSSVPQFLSSSGETEQLRMRLRFLLKGGLTFFSRRPKTNRNTHAPPTITTTGSCKFASLIVT